MEGVEGETRRGAFPLAEKGRIFYYPRMRPNSVQYATDRPRHSRLVGKKTDAESHSSTRNKSHVEYFVNPDLVFFVYDGKERTAFFGNVLLRSIALLWWWSTAIAISQAAVIYKTSVFHGRRRGFIHKVI